MSLQQLIKFNSFVLICLLSLQGFAQQTSVFDNPQQSYDQAVDLYNKAKYGSAIVIFDQLANEEKSIIQADAEYYGALCASQLLHPDAIIRFGKFIINHPQNAQINQAYFELGKLQIADKDYRNALENFDKVDKYELTVPQQQELFFKTGYAYFKTDNLKKARENFALIINKPGAYTIPANYYYAYIAYSEKNYETALKHFGRVANDPTFREAVNFYIIQIYAVQGRYDEMLEKAQPLVKQSNDKKIIEITRLVADAYFHKGDYAKAVKYFALYTESNPSSISPVDMYEIAFASYQTENYPQAIKYFQLVATGQDSLSQNAYYHLGDCFVKTNQKRFAFNAFSSAYKIKADPAILEDALFNYAKLAIELSYNPYNEAVMAVQEYLDKYPQSPRRDEGYGYLADLYLLTKNYKNALTSIQQIKKRSARLDAAYQRIAYYRGIELFNENDYDGAIKLFKEARNVTSDNAIKAASSYWLGEAFYNTARYDNALDAYNKFLVTPGVLNSPLYSEANYNIGYCYFKKKEYNKAALSYRKYLTESSEDIKITGDADLRVGDCYFMTKDYASAIDFYEKAVAVKAADADYALYQVGISYGVQGNLQNKITSLKKLLKTYDKSSYVDEALYETGLTYNMLNQDADALDYFQKIVKGFPKSAYVKKSLLKTGLIYFNQNRDQEALAILKRVAKDYPGSPESREALASIKSIYVEMNQVDEYVDFIKEVPSVDVTKTEQDSLTYIAAENQYMNGSCEKATEGFTKYISKFQQGAFILQANFYKAECEYRTQKFDLALQGYEFILGQQRSRFTSNSASRAAQIYLSRKNYEAALENFIRLEEAADQPILVTTAVYGQMHCNYQLKKYGLAIQSAQKLLALNKLPDNQAIEAHLTIGRSAYALENPELARKEFEETLKLSKNEMGAEAKFMIAQLQWDNAKLDDCEKTIFSLSDNYASYDFWVAKGFLLLSDVYVKKGNVFQARQTLQSIIDNYEGDDLKQVAREKLAALAKL